MILTGATTSVALQMFSSNKENKVTVFKINLLVNFIIAFFISIIISLFANEIMSIYGKNYEAYFYLIYVISILTIFATIDSIYNKFFISNDKLNSYYFIYDEDNLSLLLSFAFLLYYISFFILDTFYILFNHKEYFIREKIHEK